MFHFQTPLHSVFHHFFDILFVLCIASYLFPLLYGFFYEVQPGYGMFVIVPSYLYGVPFWYSCVFPFIRLVYELLRSDFISSYVALVYFYLLQAMNLLWEIDEYHFLLQWMVFCLSHCIFVFLHSDKVRDHFLLTPSRENATLYYVFRQSFFLQYTYFMYVISIWYSITFAVEREIEFLVYACYCIYLFVFCYAHMIDRRTVFLTEEDRWIFYEMDWERL
jgi:hypothetical protein